MAVFTYGDQRLTLVDIDGDGNCMFSAISYCIYGDTDLGPTIRETVVPVVVERWQELGAMTSDTDGMPFLNENEYCKYPRNFVFF